MRLLAIALSENDRRGIINRLSAPEFPRIYEHLRDAGIFAWQIQLTVPMGNAADNSEFLQDL